MADEAAQQVDQNVFTQLFKKDNSDMINTTIIQTRLDTKPLLAEIYKFLTGKVTVYEAKAGGVFEEKIKSFGVEMANQKGQQGIMSFLNSILNSSVVQGNFTKDRYNAYITQVHDTLTIIIVANRRDWGIAESQMDAIIMTIMNSVRPFISRLIDDKERLGYNKQIQMSETSVVNQKSGGFNIFK